MGEKGRLKPVVRTCIGCRERVDASTLVRFVAVQEFTTTVVTPDLGRSLPGRGAHLHPAARCLELATRRKAWGRALRTEGPFDLSAVQQFINPAPFSTAPSSTASPNGTPPGAP